MACDLTQGYSWAGCDGGPGGIAEIGFCELNNKNTITIAAGVITAMALQSGKVFRKYVVRPETAFYSDIPTKDPKSGGYSYAPTVNLSLFTMATTMRQEVLLLLQNNLMVITKDNQGIYRLGGYNFGMQLTSGGGEGGVLLQDAPKQVLNLVGVDTVPMYQVQQSLIATIMP